MGRVRLLVVVGISAILLAGCGKETNPVPPEPDAPAPTWVYISQTSPNEVTVRWTDVTSDEAGFIVQRAASINGSYADVATLTANTTRYTDTTVTPGGVYYYRVLSFDVFDVRSKTSAAVFIRATEDEAPLTPSDPSPATDISDLEIPGLLTLSWSGGDPDQETVLFDLYFGEATDALALVSGATTATTFTLTNPLELNRFYFWRVVATDPEGAGALSPVWSFGTKIERVEVPEGYFFMGDCGLFYPTVPSRFCMGNHPVNGRNPVYVDRFLIDKYEVSNQLFAQFLNSLIRQKLVRVEDGTVYSIVHDTLFAQVYPEGDQDSGIEFVAAAESDSGLFVSRPGRENHPVVEVSWYGAGRFAHYFGWELPNERQWEKAARGTSSDKGDTTFAVGDSSVTVGFGFPYPWGDVLEPHAMNYSGSGDPFESSVGTGTTPVGYFNGETHGGFATSSNASQYGIYDMSGNAAEWCSDDFYPYDGGPYGGMKVVKGGGWRSHPVQCQTFWRQEAIPDSTDNMIGFRTIKVD